MSVSLIVEYEVLQQFLNAHLAIIERHISVLKKAGQPEFSLHERKPIVKGTSPKITRTSRYSRRCPPRSASVEELFNEYNLFGILLRTKRGSSETEPPLNVDGSPQMTLALLREAKSEITSSTGGRAVSHRPCLSWKNLVELYGDTEILHRRVKELKNAKFADSEELIALAEEYIAGRQDEMTQ